MEVGEAPCQRNQTSNQTSARGLVSWPRLPRFGHFPFHFPFRGEKGSAPCGRFLWGAPPPPPGAEPSKNVWRPRAPTWALLGAQPHSPLVRPRESLLTVSASPLGGRGVGPQLGMAADMPFGRPGLGATQTRLLTRHLQEVWFLGHACHALATSLFTSLFRGEKGSGPKGAAGSRGKGRPRR